MRSPLILLFICSITGTFCFGQSRNLPLYLISIGGISGSHESPYSIPKKVASSDLTLTEVANENYKLAFYGDTEFAIFEKKNRKVGFQLLIKQDEFTLLCEHYVEENCDCFEGLHILTGDMVLPSRVRCLWPFSLKANLIDEIEAKSDLKLDDEKFESVCDILESVDMF